MVGLVALLLLLVVLVHGYVYLRAVHSAATRGRGRIVGGLALALLGTVVATALLTRGSLAPDVARPLHLVGFRWLAVAM